MHFVPAGQMELRIRFFLQDNPAGVDRLVGFIPAHISTFPLLIELELYPGLFRVPYHA